MDNLKPKQIKTKRYMLVRFGKMNDLGLFDTNDATLRNDVSRVVVKTERGLELGYVVGQVAAGQFKLSSEQIKEYYNKSEVEFSPEPVGRFERYATPEDLSEEKHLAKIAREEMQRCKNFVKEMNLPMSIIDVEHIFGGERIIFYFMADSRVDFRDLVKKIAYEYQTRIEMRQIGSRDEAKLLGDYETCGQQCCCQRFLKVLKPVNMRMAKMQKATLDPSKISGFCGRLKCCLRYEDDTYTELKRRLPRKNSLVQTPQGEGRVIDGQILTQLVLVEFKDGNKAAIPLEELTVVGMADFKEPQADEDIQEESRENPPQDIQKDTDNNNIEEDVENNNDADAL